MLNIEKATQNISIKTKLLFGFGVVLLILLTISLLSYQALNALTARFALVNQVQKVNLLVSEARQQEKNFILRKDMQYALRAQQLVSQARDLGQSAIPLFTQQASRDQMQLLLNHVNDYQLLLQQLSAYGEQTTQSIILDTETKMTAAAREADAANVTAAGV